MFIFLLRRIFQIVELMTFRFEFVDKKPKPENIDIYTLRMTPDRRCKVIKVTLADVWKQGCIIRINNFGDKEKTPHPEKDIKNQVRISFCCIFYICFTEKKVNEMVSAFFNWFS